MQDLITESLKRFDEKYFDKNSISGLNQKGFKNVVELVKDQRDFLYSELKSACEKRDAELGHKITKDLMEFFCITLKDLPAFPPKDIDFIKLTCLIGLNNRLKDRDAEWLDGKRCLGCGSEKEYDPLCDTCDKCLNEN
jgi:hypothetical protein